MRRGWNAAGIPDAGSRRSRASFSRIRIVSEARPRRYGAICLVPALLHEPSAPIRARRSTAPSPLDEYRSILSDGLTYGSLLALSYGFIMLERKEE